MRERKDLGIGLDFLNTSVQRHSHMEVELLFCLKGCLEARIGGQPFEFLENDVAVVNSGREHELILGEDTLVCRIMMDYEMLADEAGSGIVEFSCNSMQHPEESFEALRDILEDIVEEYSMGTALDFRKKELFYKLLVCLMNRYVREYRSKAERLSEDAVMSRTLAYISENLTKPLSLKSAAGLSFMSDSAFSKYFKRKMGVNFGEYVAWQRLERARQELLYTDKSMTEIAMDCGYTNSSVFTKAFRAMTGTPPSNYRRQASTSKDSPPQPAGTQAAPGMAAQGPNTQAGGIQAARAPIDGLRGIAAQPIGFSGAAPQLRTLVQERRAYRGGARPCREMTVDSAKAVPYDHVWNQCINGGTAAELLSGRLQQHILMLKETLGFRYVRISNIFSWEMKLRENQSYEELNFETVDTVLDFIVSNGMHPMIEAGDKPRRAMRSSGQILFFEDEGAVFRSFGEMKAIYERFIAHVTLRYGASEAEQWIFENWYDGRSSRAASPYDYLEAFDAIWEIVKSRLPGARVGGCGLELGGPWPDFLEKWQHRKHLPDFISFCAFPYRRNVTGFDPGAAVRSGDTHFMANTLKAARERLEGCGLGNIDLYLTEWNLSISDRNFFNDCCGKGALMLSTMKALTGLVKMGVFWYGSDMNTSYYDTKALLFGGAGLISKDALKKPAFFALDFMGRLGDFALEAGEGCIAATNGRGSCELLLYNDKHLNYTYYLKDEATITVEDTKRIFENDDPLEMKISMIHMTPGEYFIKTEKITPACGNLLLEWQELGNTQALGLRDFEYLKQICVPKLHIRKQKTSGERLELSQLLEPHEMCLIHIYPAITWNGGT